ncbi:MAG: hypothetical protein C0405_05150 [Desulfovibrio sp.]|nr:hypothetical protein [Desulfovibrio sp.]
MTHRMPPCPVPLPAWGLACCMLLCAAPASASPRADASPPLVFEANVAVPMRDGVLLRADIWRPAGGGPFPALVCRTPYGKSSDPDELRFARSAVARGYAVLIQDVRGRFASGGEFVPHVSEGRDGFDTIEWTARQSWCDGRVGAFGLSYPGTAQWFAALEQPPHLLAMAPAMSFSSLREGIYPGGVFDLDWARWALVAMAPDTRARKGLPGPKTGRAAWADWKRRGPTEIQAHLPLLTLPDLDPAVSFYAEWLRHPPDDPWWDYGDFAGRYGQVTAAVLNLSGWHDDSFGVQGAIANHLGLLAARKSQASTRGNQADPRSLLVLGPWSHGINAITGDVDYGTREFGPQAHLDYDGLVLDFMDRHVRGLDNRLAQAKPVRYFIMGANQWREDDAWPPRGTQPYAIHLGPRREGRAPSRLSHAAPAPGPSSSTFTADPANPVREIPGSDLGPMDQRELTPHNGLLLFETRPLKRDMTVAGHIRAEIYLSADAPDLDLYVKLLDVTADGTAYNLMDAGAEVRRASLRGQARQRSLLEPGRVYRLDLDTLLTANTFHKGDRIRVVLCASWFPGMSRNLQTGASEAVSATTRPARVTVHHDAAHPSRLILPVLP